MKACIYRSQPPESRCQPGTAPRGGVSTPPCENPPSPAETVKRYPHPIPAPLADPGTAHSQICLEHILETMQRQNQLLLDLLSAVNALSAAVLTPHSPR